MNTLVLRRRLFYISAMVLLLVPLYYLGAPSVRSTDGSVVSQGGSLAQLRTAYDLGQSDLGEMDPASESMRLATLGLRGVAATILWQKAEYYRREEYWDRLSATLNQIAVLQPHFVKVWEFQAHNLSYNISVEFDDYRQRYAWVKRGMNYLIKGSKFNKTRTEMPYELGWFFGNKLGVADEKVQFRELYRNDVNYHNDVYESSEMELAQDSGLGPDGKPDNWRAGALWYRRAYDMADRGMRLARSTMMFYRMAPLWDMKHAEAIQAEGYLDDPARVAWERSERSWSAFGDRPIRTSFGDTIFLNEIEQANEKVGELQKEFEALAGDVYDEMLAEKMKLLSERQLAAYQTDELDRTFEDVRDVETAMQILEVDPRALAMAVPESKRVEALQLANQLAGAKQKISHIEVYRQQINYAYWLARSVAEQSDDSLLARTSMYEANKMLDRGELDGALAKFEQAWESWSALFNHFPSMMIDDVADDVIDSIDRYRRLLDQPDLPEDFALNDFIQFRTVYEQELADFAMMSVIADWPKRYPGRNFLKEMLSKSTLERKERLTVIPEYEGQISPGPMPTLPNGEDAALPSPALQDINQPMPVDIQPTSDEAETKAAPAPMNIELSTPDAGSAPTPEVSEAVSSTSEASEEIIPEAGASIKVVAPEEGSAPKPK